MGLLAQVIPALRDARTPLAVGIMWTIALWIDYFLIPKDTFNTSQVEELARPLGRLPTELMISIGVLLVYVLGIFLEMISRFFSKIMLAAMVGIFLINLYYNSEGASFVGFLSFFAAIYVVLFIVSALRNYLVFRRAGADALASALDAAYRQLLRPVTSSVARVKSILQPESGPFQEVLRRELEDVFAKNPDLIPDAVRTIDPGVLSDAAVAMNLSTERMWELSGPSQRQAIERLEAEHLLQRRLRKDEALQVVARRTMLEQLNNSPGARWAFAGAVYDMSALLESLNDRLRDAIVGLRKENNELYQEYDRRLAEGEFRRGISIPAVALLASVSVLICNILSLRLTVSSLSVPLFGAMIVGGTLHAAGTYRMKEAAGFLYACVRNEYVGLGRRELFGTELLVPTEVTALTRMSEFSYEFKELRMNAKLMLVRRAAAVVNRLAGNDTNQSG